MVTALQIDRTQDVTAFWQAAEWTGIRDDDREAWMKARDTMITASDVAAILGEDPHKSPLDVYVDKVTPRPYEQKLALDDPRFWGKILEQPVLSAVAEYYGWQYRRGGFLLRSRRWQHLGCTLDAEIDRGSGWIPLEGKTTRVPRGWSEEDGELPTRVLIQTQTQLAVTEAPHELVFALLQGSRPVQIEIDPSPELHKIIAEAAEEMISRIATLDPPPAGAGDRWALEKLHPLADGSVIELPADVVEWTAEIQHLAEKRLEVQTREDLLKARIRQLLGDATYGVLPVPVGGKGVWKCATEERPEHTVEASSSRVLRCVKELPKQPKKGRRS